MYCSQNFILFLSLIVLSSSVQLSDFYDYTSSPKSTGTTVTRSLPVPMDNLNGLAPQIVDKGQIGDGYQNQFYSTNSFYRIGVVLPRTSIDQTLNSHQGVYIQDVTSSDTTLLGQIQSHINNGISNAFPSPPTAAYITTMINATASPGSPGTTYQLIVATNGQSTFGIIMITSVEPEAITRGDRGVVDYGIRSTVYSGIGTIALKFPYDGNIGQATTMSLNSNRGGEYIFRLSVPPPCPCKERTQMVICEYMKKKGTDPLPIPCRDST